MTQLVRDKLRPLLRNLNSAHAGLLIQRGLSDWEESAKESKRDLIDTITNVSETPLYQLAFDRWLMLTHSQIERFAHTAAIMDGRLFTGLATGGTLETGVCTHHTYGMPMLPGSGVKGAVRNYAVSIGLDAKYLQVLFGSDEEKDAVSTASGALVWHDAWWVAGTTPQTRKPFVGEVITVHHQEYYSEKAAVADGSESPIPNQQLAVQGGFYFVIEGDSQWAQFALDLLKQMLQQQGMGAKTASGYGYFQAAEDGNDSQRLQKRLQTRYQELSTQLLSAAAAEGGSDALFKQIIQSLNVDDLAENLSKNKNKFLEKLNIDKEDVDAIKKLCQLVWELRQQDMSNWLKEGKNKERAYKFVQNNL